MSQKAGVRIAEEDDHDPPEVQQFEEWAGPRGFLLDRDVMAGGRRIVFKANRTDAMWVGWLARAGLAEDLWYTPNPAASKKRYP